VFAIAPSLPPTPRARVDKAKSLLDRALGPSKVLTSPDSCERFCRDESEAEGRIPDIVVLAEEAADIRATLEAAAQAEVPVTPRAGGTGRSGGAVPVAGGIVLATLGMNRIKEIDRGDLVVVAEPGVVLKDLHAAVEAEGLFFPPDPNSLETCALGGNVGENAGGPRAFKYGVTRDYVLALEATLMGGTRLRTGRRTVKGVAGYDVTALLVGSEGTLAVFSEVTLKLIPKPEAVMTVLGLFGTVGDATRAVTAMVARKVVPRCVEMMDAGALEAIRGQAVGVDARARAMLLVDVDGDERECERDLERVGEACSASGALEVLAAQSAAQRDRLWAARRELSTAIRRGAKNKLAEDIVVPPSRITAFLEAFYGLSERFGVRTLCYGHAGDGNLHVNFLWEDDSELPRVKQAIEATMRQVVAMRGTITGEHGVGVLKIPYLPIEQSESLIGLQTSLKEVFDPARLLNPGKIFAGRGHGAS
jgi:glycolate oxidase